MKLRNLPQIILDLNICTIFIILSMFTLKNILPIGQTTRFFDRGYILAGIALFFFLILFVLSFFFQKDLKLKKKFQLPELKDITLLSLPMSPVISL